MSIIVKALSVREPWATLLVYRYKTIECRTWSVKYRGPLCICASGAMNRKDKGNSAYFRDAFPAMPPVTPGHALGVVTLTDCRPMKVTESVFSLVYHDPTTIGWFVENAYRFRNPFPVKGRLGLFDIELTDAQAREVGL